MNAIFDLTGGNHRLLAMLATFLTVEGLTELVGPFVQTVDRELTPYYQQRLDRLSPQQYKILRAIADHRGRAVTVKEIGRDTYLASQVVSRQLFDLLEAGLVRRTQVGRESFYELNEPLLRLVLDIKEGRDRPLPLVVSFLRRWYDAKDLRRFEGAAPPGVREYYEAALNEDTGITETVDQRLGRDSIAADGVSPEIKLSRSGHRRVQIAWAELEVPADPMREQIEGASLVLERGLELRRRGRSAEALSAFDQVVASFGSSDQAALLERVARALVNKGITLGQLNRGEEEIKVYDEVISRFVSSDQPAILEQVAEALINKGYSLGRLNRDEEAIAVYDELISRFVSSDQAALLERVARALFNKAITLGQLNRSEEAISVYDEVLARFGTTDQPALRIIVADSLAAKARLALEAGNQGEAIRASERALAVSERHGGATSIHIRALLQTGNASRALDFAKTQLTGETHSESVRLAVARALLEESHASKPILRQLVPLFAGDADILASSLLAWIKHQLPISEDRARKLEETDDALHEVFGGIAECSLALKLFRAARFAALGDRKALFDLPLEVRRLIPSESNES